MLEQKVLESSTSNTEHWMDKRIRLGRPIAMRGNYIRISAKNLLKLMELKNQLTGKRLSMKEQHDESKDKAEEIW